MASFQHTLQHVPQLLQALLSSSDGSSTSGLKDLRRVCKQTSVIALLSVRTCRIKLSPQLAGTGPLLELATLLKDSRLQHLSVDIHVQAGNFNPPSLHELATQTAQLRQFLSIMGAAVRMITSLYITLTFEGHMNERQKIEHDMHTSGCNTGNKSSRNGSAPEEDVFLSSAPAAQSAMIQLASLLDNACPAVWLLGVGGGVGEEVMRMFGRRLHTNITTLKVLQGGFWGGQFGSTLSGQMLPHVVQLVMPDTSRYRTPPLERIHRLLLNPSLTHLEVGDGWFKGEEDWSLVSPHLQSLRCHSLCIFPGAATLPAALRFNRLKSVSMQVAFAGRPYNGIGLTALHSFLRAAPSLRSLSVQHGSRINTLVTHDRCSAWVRGELGFLHTCMSSGLLLAGVKLCCLEPNPILAAAPDPGMLDTLASIPQLTNFEACELTAVHRAAAPNCLAEITRALPNLKKLSLSGPWGEADVVEGLVFESVESIDLRSTALSVDVLVRLTTCMPGLVSLLYHSMTEDACDSLQARLRASQAIVATSIDDGRPRLGDWVETRNGPRSMRTVWIRAQ